MLTIAVWVLVILLIIVIFWGMIILRRKESRQIAITKRLLENLTLIAMNIIVEDENDKRMLFRSILPGAKQGRLHQELYKLIPDDYKGFITLQNLDMIIDNAHLRIEEDIDNLRGEK